jgi:hypothetical protein
MSIDPEDDELVALKRKAGDAEIAIIRTSASREKDTTDDGPPEEKADLSQVEINYVYVKLKKKCLLLFTYKRTCFQQKIPKVSRQENEGFQGGQNRIGAGEATRNTARSSAGSSKQNESRQIL